MFRPLLTTVLMLLVALPHGICLCHHLHASAPPIENCCGHEDDAEPAAPSPQPSENDDDDDRDCSCKLNQELAPGAGAVSVERDSKSSISCVTHAVGHGVNAVGSDARPHACRIADGPTALILCALRI